MSIHFAETLKQLRMEKGLSQRELAERLFVTRTAVTRWENGSRLPDAVMIAQISRCLGINVNTLLRAAAASDGSPNVILVDDQKIVLSGSMPILKEVLPHATVTGFSSPAEAVEYAKANRVSLAFLDIELGKMSGFDLCKTLLDINHQTNVVFLTAYAAYALDAWQTGASGFLLKPITAESVRTQLENLRYPLSLGESEDV